MHTICSILSETFQAAVLDFFWRVTAIYGSHLKSTVDFNQITPYFVENENSFPI